MRGLGKKLPIPSPLLPSRSLLPYSTFSGGGRGRGRGRGLGVPPPPPSPDDHDPPSVPSLGHGHGRGAAPSSGGPILSSFPSFVAPSPSLGRGQPQPSPPPENPNSKKPIFFTRDKAQFSDTADDGTNKTLGSGPHQPFPSLPGAGRGKAPAAPSPKPAETNRHARPRQPIGAKPSAGPTEGPRLSQEEAVKKAVEVLMRGETGRGRGRGRGVRGRDGGRGRGGRGRRDADDEFELYVGDNADGEKFVKRMGEERMKVIEEAFEEMSSRVLPSPVEDAYLDALHTNNLVKCTFFYCLFYYRLSGCWLVISTISIMITKLDYLV